MVRNLYFIFDTYGSLGCSLAANDANLRKNRQTFKMINFQRSPPAVHLPVTTNKLTPAVSSHNNNTMESQKMASDDSPSPNGSTAGTSSGAPLKKRRKRTNLDLAQRSALDAFFDMNARPDHDRMAEIAEIVGLDRDVSCFLEF